MGFKEQREQLELKMAEVQVELTRAELEKVKADAKLVEAKIRQTDMETKKIGDELEFTLRRESVNP